ncbi:TetR/AcrR family transcriptional regulator [Nonomuraea sp. MCN248]|uniref:TetR/AcrR family transcriptional regulator n=1 Tax=Nonomuraea corallina TaxID=2989783 RepID=A0ABT4S5M9_9ACTN|nr:TetR/AcrR family transcriptional regulator [Nonomuraea corallina]MDA0632506.1 TetR/AcrR family transcriptional regulator [Nonomuraea corallina]
MNPDDPRAQRTRASLRAAVLDLAVERDLSALTVSAVAGRAGVNRATFYLHYPDVDALAADAMEEAVAEVAGAAALCPLDAPRDHAPEPLTTLFAHVSENAELYACMLGGQGSPRFCARLRERLTGELEARFAAGSRPGGHTDVPPGVHAAYLAGALTGVIAHWVTGPRDTPPAEVALAFWRLFRMP